MKKLLLLLLLLPFCSLTQINNESLNKEFVVKLNEYRKQNGLDPVKLDDKSIYRAKLQAEYCSKVEDLTHDCPSWFPPRWAECALWNMDDPSAESYLYQWMDSPPHNDLLLLDGATRIGIYYTPGVLEGDEGYYAVLVLN
jgi:uncharacterized protein YkwD